MAIEVVVPELGESVVEATVARWLKQEGDRVTVGEPLVSLETDKIDLEVTAEADGVLARIQHQAGEDVQVGDVLAYIEEAEGAAAPQEAPPAQEEAAGKDKAQERAETKPEAKPEAKTAPRAESPETRATPVAQRMAAQEGVDLSQVSGAGPGGRVTKEDVAQYLRSQERSRDGQAPSPAREAAAPESPAPSAEPGRREERIRMSRRRRTIAERLVQAQQTAAMLTTFNEVDMSAVMEMRQRHREAFQQRHGVKLGFMSFFVKATIGALKAFPPLNASIDGNDIILKHYYDIGIAVGAEEGLVVPVLRDADRMSFAQIEQAIDDMARRAREGSLTLEELRGGTFTITNGGVFGSLLSTPILNPPQVGILGLHKIEQRPVVVNGEIVIRPMMYLALTYDHRIVDGREAVQFLVKVKELIEDPERLLLEG
ncbi:2-oxoglutarate dehydrogenase complex dihydrolipoyllysine-residue succinyltransferase [Litorilinea aerophila]|uniref:Dihydrolipoyllysine-residue succinyltransferase component of 2-oxoglutarate dehydrogenase complex n=1 Tax=Litorilinea aerophila TaxID=1204385 RepID=A0A540V8J2_9CHLR|nr:2-oxoglutarate dehydrogenase complex dihydrolipoyllysine-residue succinyltransferase [Litorilinea aerophila]MCC9078971.1 2-oxoglutarate dehydrogenase complex dihydrolipoyllysine-residue succinyltransferase [Litorilinea aerophila]GIV77376.1 MAG: dihydrolipoyllysine-residue succinyltransferase component of 2-oxoglutarate dehydrogenase complex [Litorilinea sp.]